MDCLTSPSLIVYYRPDFKDIVDGPTYITDLEKLINRTILVATTLVELAACLNRPNIDLLAIYWGVIKEHIGIGVKSFIDMVQILAKYEINQGTYPTIAICIDDKCSQRFIERIKSAQISNIIPASAKYGTLATAKALEDILAGNSYWPTDIISRLPAGCNDAQKPLLVYFRHNAASYITCDIQLAINNESLCNLVSCESLDELSAVMRRKPSSIVVHIDIFKQLNISVPDFIKLLNTLLYCVDPLATVNIGVAFEPTTTQEEINELLNNDIICLNPGYDGFGKDECMAGINAVTTAGKYVPKHIISKLPLRGTKAIINKSVRLTDRQSQVLKLVANRGLSNKKIASQLKISESTVKIHISAILREYGVRNRTQLALAASSSLKA